MTFVPNYYSKFSCIAEKCTHNCCIGWEIDIDEETLGKYMHMGGTMGKRLKAGISFDETPHFVLSADERCPFLNSRGLCDIIAECGEDHLCEICKMHPRFVNTYSEFCEMGLGLCCEEAARIIVSEEMDFSLVCEELSETDNLFREAPLLVEAEFLSERAEIFEIIQNRSLSVAQNVSELCGRYGIDMSFPDMSSLCEIYLSLERLDHKWTELLEELSHSDIGAGCIGISEFERASRNLLCYFIYRHSAESLYDDDMESKVKFAVAGTFIIIALCEMHKEKSGNIAETDIAEYARMFSAEVEYSEENTQMLFEIL